MNAELNYYYTKYPSDKRSEQPKDTLNIQAVNRKEKLWKPLRREDFKFFFNQKVNTKQVMPLLEIYDQKLNEKDEKIKLFKVFNHMIPNLSNIKDN